MKLAGVDDRKYGELNQTKPGKEMTQKYRLRTELWACHTLNKIPKMPAGDWLWSLNLDFMQTRIS